MFVKFKSLDAQEKLLVVIKLMLCFFAGALSAVLIFKLLGL